MKVYDKKTSAGVSAGRSSLTFKIGDDGNATVNLDRKAFEQIGRDFDLFKGRFDDNVEIAKLITNHLKILIDA